MRKLRKTYGGLGEREEGFGAGGVTGQQAHEGLSLLDCFSCLNQVIHAGGKVDHIRCGDPIPAELQNDSSDGVGIDVGDDA